MTNWEKYFGTPERAWVSLSVLNFEKAKDIERSAAFWKHIDQNDAMLPHEKLNVVEWHEWLQEEAS